MRDIWLSLYLITCCGLASAQPQNDPFITNGRLMYQAITKQEEFKVAALLKVPYVDPNGFVEVSNRRITFLPLAYSGPSLQSQRIFKMLLDAGAQEGNCELLRAFGRVGTPETNTTLLLEKDLLDFNVCNDFWVMRNDVSPEAMRLALEHGYRIRENIDGVDAAYQPTGSEISYSMHLAYLDKTDLSSAQADKALMILNGVDSATLSRLLTTKSNGGFRLIDLLVYSSCKKGTYQPLKRSGWVCDHSKQSPNMLRLLDYVKQNGSPPVRTDCYPYIPYKTYPPVCWFFD